MVFATETGAVAACDPRLLTGVVFGQLGAEPEPKAFFKEMEASPAFRQPLRWGDVDPSSYDGLLLTGGHAKGMRQYLESRSLQEKVAAFWSLNRRWAPSATARLCSPAPWTPAPGKSVLFKKRTTCLCGYMERTAWLITAWKLGDYYRTYPAYVEDEVCQALEHPAQQFVKGPIELMRKGQKATTVPPSSWWTATTSPHAGPVMRTSTPKPSSACCRRSLHRVEVLPEPGNEMSTHSAPSTVVVPSAIRAATPSPMASR